MLPCLKIFFWNFILIWKCQKCSLNRGTLVSVSKQSALFCSSGRCPLILGYSLTEQTGKNVFMYLLLVGMKKIPWKFGNFAFHKLILFLVLQVLSTCVSVEPWAIGENFFLKTTSSQEDLIFYTNWFCIFPVTDWYNIAVRQQTP